MTPASVFHRLPVRLRAAFTAALLLPAVGLRAQTPGTIDTSFNAGTLSATVYAVDYQDDTPGQPKITVGGDKSLGAYFLSDGTPRTDFLFPAFGNPARIIFTIVPERVFPDGSSLPNILLGGQFDGGFGRSTNGNKPAQNIVRLAPDGSFDTGFSDALGTGANNFVTSLLPLLDGRAVIGGLFTAVNKQPRRRVARLLSSGGVDPDFAVGLNIDKDVLALAESIDPVSGIADGNTLVGGIFNHVAGQPYAKLVRLDPNGNLDMSFHPSIDLRVVAILVQPDGKIVIGGDFTNVNGTPVARLARLNYDGSLDPTFTGGVTGVPNNDVNPTAVYVLKPISDGRIYVGGEFAQFNGTPRQYLALMSADGVLDTSFDPARTIYNSVQSIAVQSDNNLLIGEALGPRINNKYPPSIIRLFGVTPNSSVAAVAPTVQSVQQTSTVEAVTKPTSAPARSLGATTRPYIW